MLHLPSVAVLVVEPLNHVADGTRDEFDNLSGGEDTKEKKHGTAAFVLGRR